MMKSLSKNVVISLVMVLIGLLILTGTVKALSPDSLSIINGISGGNLTAINDVANDVANETTLNVVNTVTPTNIVRVNEIATEKDLPQTGENDIYVITVIGLAAVVIGSVAYAKSRKYDI